MEVAITKISKNGQVVISAEIRKDALTKDIHLLQMIERSEEQIKAGKFTKADISINDEEIDDLLTA